MILRVKPLIGEEKVIEIEPTDHIQAVKEKLQELEGTSADQQRLLYRGKHLQNDKTVESYRLKNGATLQMIKALRKLIYKKWLSQRYQNLSPSREIILLLESLRKRFRIGLITNGPSAAQWEKIEKLNLRSYFDVILVSGDLSYEKPDKSIFWNACDQLKVNPKYCLMVGDKLETDIQGGVNADFGGTVWIPLGSRQELIDSSPQPDYVIKDVMELKCLLLSPVERNKKLNKLRLEQAKKVTISSRKLRMAPLYIDLNEEGDPEPYASTSSTILGGTKFSHLNRVLNVDEDSNSNASDGS